MNGNVLKNEPLIIGASNATASGRYVEVSNCDRLTITVVATVSAATLQATVSLGTTNDDPVLSTFPTLTNGTLIASTTPATWTYAAGVLTANNPAIGTHELTIDYGRFGKWVRAAYVYTSGGGAIDLRVMLGAWSVG